MTTWEFLYIYIYIYNISIRIISFCLLQIFVRCVRAISCQLEILTNLKITDWITNIVSVHNVHISLREYPNIGKTRNLFRCNCTRSLEGRFICLWEQSAACRTFTNPTTSKQLSIQTRYYMLLRFLGSFRGSVTTIPAEGKILESVHGRKKTWQKATWSDPWSWIDSAIQLRRSAV